MAQRSAGATYRGAPIAGTTVFTGARSQQGYRINKLAMSLTGSANRAAFRHDAGGYMKKYGLTENEMGLIERRDWSGLVAAQNLLEMGAQMRGETLDAFLKTRPGRAGTAVERNR